MKVNTSIEVFLTSVVYFVIIVNKPKWIELNWIELNWIEKKFSQDTNYHFYNKIDSE